MGGGKANAEGSGEGAGEAWGGQRGKLGVAGEEGRERGPLALGAGHLFVIWACPGQAAGCLPGGPHGSRGRIAQRGCQRLPRSGSSRGSAALHGHVMPGRLLPSPLPQDEIQEPFCSLSSQCRRGQDKYKPLSLTDLPSLLEDWETCLLIGFVVIGEPREGFSNFITVRKLFAEIIVGRGHSTG